MIFPRLEKKGHGTGRRIEGRFEEGERVVLVDDLITSGTAKIEAIEVLRQAGLVVEDIVVLIERGEQGRKELERAGVRLHAIMHVSEFIDEAEAAELLDPETVKRVRRFLAEDGARPIKESGGGGRQ
jgi:uridine monophosphate synthetase